MAVSKSQIKATAKYNAKNYDKITMRFPKGDKDQIVAYAEAHGESMTAFFLRAAKETMLRDAEKERTE